MREGGGSGPGQTTACDRSRPETTLRHAGKRAGSRPAIHSFSARLTLSAHRFRSVVWRPGQRFGITTRKGGGGTGSINKIVVLDPCGRMNCVISRDLFCPVLSSFGGDWPLIIAGECFASHAV